MSTTRPCYSIEFIESFLFWFILVTYSVTIYICIYLHIDSYIHSFFVIFNSNVFSALHAKYFEIWIFFCVKLMSWFLHSAIHQLMWYFGAFIVNPFSLLWSIFFLRKLYFLWSPCLLLIAELISLHTSDMPTVGFFLKITFPSWIILSVSFDELDSVDWLLRSCWRIFLK